LTQRRYEALVQGKNVEKESIPVYTPDRWLVGQLPTKSNICGRKWTPVISDQELSQFLDLAG
jgi:hypothetical protein